MEDSTHSGTSLKAISNQNISAILGNTDIDAALQFWKQFDLSQARQRWDKVCNEMREMKTASIAGRKRLVDLTKSFRAKPKEEQIASVTELLKAYQEEIDQLSKRSKLSETSFLTVFKSLYEAPDPGLYLEQLLQSILNSNTHTYEIQRLKAELAQYEEEFQHLKNQEVTIRRLEDQLQEFQQNNELKILEEVERRTEIIREECQQEVLEAKELQKSVERRLSLALESAKQAQTASDRAQSQLLEVSTKYEERLSALLNENSLLADNIHRLQLRCNEMETEQEQSRKGSNISPPPYSPNVSNHAADSEKQGSYELLLNQLRSELQEKEERYRLEKLTLESSLRELQHQQLKEKEVTHKLKQELLERPSKQDFTVLKKRLKLVEKIAFHSANEDRRHHNKTTEEADDDDVDEEEIGPENTMIPLEHLLTTKVQTLEKELLSLRKQNLELKETETTQREIVANLRLSLDNKQQILHRLEQELESRNNALERMIKDQQAKKENTLTDLATLIGVKDEGATKSQHHDSSKQETGETVTGGGERNDAVKQMIDVLTNQRDRYKERLTQAEAKLLKTEEMLEAMTNQKSRLEEENLQLYAKIKFLQSYSQSASQQRTATSSSSTRHRQQGYAEESRYSLDHQDPYYRHLSIESEDIESKYDRLYEQRMNPFAEFSLHEKQRKLRELSVADRIVLNTTLAIVQSNLGRNFLLIYLGAMHLLVFVTIYYTAHNVHHGCDPSLDHIAKASAAAALHGVHH